MGGGGIHSPHDILYFRAGTDDRFCPDHDRWDPAGAGRNPRHDRVDTGGDRAGHGGFRPGTWRDYGGFVAGLAGTVADRSRPVDRVRDPAGPGGTWRRPGGDHAAAGRTPGRPGGTWRV
jgi:hypothetical protein